MKEYGKKDFKELVEKAKNASRKRFGVALHEAGELGPRAIVICMDADSYVRPHVHQQLNSKELYIHQKGKFAVIYFDDSGKILEVKNLDETNVIVEIAPNRYHTLIALDEGSILIEISQGPYDSLSFKRFAEWAPEEQDEKSVNYLKNLKNLLN